MRNGGGWMLGSGLASLVICWFTTGPTLAQPAAGLQWIWFDEGDPAKEAPAETRYFRRTFAIDRPVPNPIDEAHLDVTADNNYTVWVNGKEVGNGDKWETVRRYDVKKHLVHGKNVIAVEAANTGGPAGLLVRLSYVPNGQSKMALYSDAAWKASKTAAKDWHAVEFDDSQWKPAKALGEYGKVGPWNNLTWEAGGSERFVVPEGFKVELVVPAKPEAKELDPKLPFSLINMCFDAKGRLLVSQERGPIVLCTQPNKEGICQKIVPYCDLVKNCQGMQWIKGALWLVGDGPQSTGLYRCTDSNGDDRIDAKDEVKLIHKFPRVKVPGYGEQGGMGEHGPHAIMQGPDGWLYLVVGNHAWAQVGPDVPKDWPNPRKLADNSPLTRWPTGLMGPDQGKPGTTEDILLPRMNDGRGHASNILAPGGTIWRMDHDGQNMSLVAAGFRNHYDAAFNPSGELFTFDSDMEWDEGLPWYRPVAVYHCPPGADFLWRTGGANTPWHYIDTLPPVATTGRGSPVGVEFYDHHAFPAKYRGAFFMADWAIGVIYAVHLERDGASYKAKPERFCQGAPMNVTDLAVGPDGGMYFTLGGRGSAGGVYRIVAEKPNPAPKHDWPHQQMVNLPQPLSAWSQAELAKLIEENGKDKKKFAQGFLGKIATSEKASVRERIRAMDIMQSNYDALELSMIRELQTDKQPEVRAHAAFCLSLYKTEALSFFNAMSKGLKDEDALVRRRACEALIRAGISPDTSNSDVRLGPHLDDVWKLLGDKDRFVRTAARLVIQRMKPKDWVERLWDEKDFQTALEGIVALCKANHAQEYAEEIFKKLDKLTLPELKPFDEKGGKIPESVLEAQHKIQLVRMIDYYRVLQLVLVHTKDRPEIAKKVAKRCMAYPTSNETLNRELAMLLTYCLREKLIEDDVHRPILEGLLEARQDRQRQIHFFYCLRLLNDPKLSPWTAEQKSRLLDWFESTKSWSGGHSFAPFMENMLKEWLPVMTAEQRAKVLAKFDEQPWTATIILRHSPGDQLPNVRDLGELYAKLAKSGNQPKIAELKESILAAIGKDKSQAAEAALRAIGDADPSAQEWVARELTKWPSAKNYPYLLKGLSSTHGGTLIEIIEALRKIEQKPKVPAEPKAEDARPFRQVLEASARLGDEKQKWSCAELLRHWVGKKFSVGDKDWKAELAGWAVWFGQTFPKEPPLPNVTLLEPQSKWKFDELLTYLEKDPRGKAGDVKNGRAIFEKANCMKCHKFGSVGEGLGPDLTTLKSRFKRADMLEANLYPSKVISDQYRGSKILTEEGKRYDGLAAVQGDDVTVLLADGKTVTLKRSEIKQMVASTVSPMPELLLDNLTREEIADLFAFLESEPPK